jgi:hypothetical protein
MDLDSPAARVTLMTTGPPSPKLDERFTKHRGSFETSLDSLEGDPGRRPSLASVFSSSDRLSNEQ